MELRDMKQALAGTLTSAAILTFISGPAWSAKPQPDAAKSETAAKEQTTPSAGPAERSTADPAQSAGTQPSDMDKPMPSDDPKLSGTTPSADRADQQASETDKQEQTGDSQASQAGDTPKSAEEQMSRATEPDNPLYRMKAEDIVGLEVVNATGESLGEVERIVVDRSENSVHAVIQVGGLFGFGGTEILANLDELELRDERLILASAVSKEALESMSTYDGSRHVGLPGDRPVGDFAAMEAGQQSDESQAPAAQTGSGEPASGTATQKKQ